jgi:hypothetical protein
VEEGDGCTLSYKRQTTLSQPPPPTHERSTRSTTIGGSLQIDTSAYLSVHGIR